MGARTVYALLVGIDAYDRSVAPLRGCVNDITAVEQLLRGCVTGEGLALDLRVLTDRAATRAAVVAGFREHLTRAGPDDVALFYYSGHGSQQPSPPEFWAIEPDHLDETLVLADSRTEGHFDLADKELAKLVAEVAARDPHVLVVLDSCHSGSGTRVPEEEDGVALRRAPVDTRPRPLDSFLVRPGEVVAAPDPPARGAEDGGWLQLPHGRHVLLSACRAGETAKEVSVEGVHRGALSVALERAVEQGGATLTYGDVHRWVLADVGNRVSRQTPQLEVSEAADRDLAFLGGAVGPRPAYATLSWARDGGWGIDAGAVHGIAAPRGGETTELAVFGHDADDLEDLAARVATARVTAVRPEGSRVDVETVDGDLDRTVTYKAVAVSTPLAPLGVVVEGDAGAAEALRAVLAGRDGRLPSPFVAEDADGELRVHASADGYRISRPASNRPLVSDISGDDAAGRTAAALEQMARWLRLATLHNPGARLDGRRLEIRVQQLGPDGEPVAGTDPRAARHDLYYDGDTAPTFRLSLRNGTDRTLYCALLDLTETYGVHNTTYETQAAEIGPGQTLHALDGRPLTAWIPDDLHAQGITQTTDLLKVVVGTAQFDVGTLLQDELDVVHAGRTVRRAPPALRSTLDRLLNRIAVRRVGAGPEDGEALADWFATDVVVSVTRPAEGAAIEAGRQVELAPGVTVEPHPTLRARARLASAGEVARSVRGPLLPPELRDDPDALPFPLHTTRDTAPDFDVLELVDVADAGAVTPDQPLRLHVDGRLDPGEELLAVGFDGEAFLPVGFGRRDGDRTEVVLQRLPQPTATTRDLRGSISVLFRKLVLRRLGADYPYPLLRLVRVEDGVVVHDADPARVRATVAAATDVLVYVHGIIGDTDGMARSSAHSTLVPPPPLIGERFQAVLAFDYENLDTPLERTAADLRDRLAEAGLGSGHGKRLVVVAHSMGGLVTRHMVEVLGGADVVSRLVTLGTPHGGSPWPSVQQWATTALAFGLNRLGDVAWPAKVLGGLVALVERVDTALDQMTPKSPFLDRLAAAPDPHVRYDLVVGLRSLLPRPQDPEPRRGFVRRLLAKLSPPRLADAALNALFEDEDNDLAVSESSAQQVAVVRDPAPVVRTVGCDHMSFFSTRAGLGALAAALDD